jgi:hypothetical protein
MILRFIEAMFSAGLIALLQQRARLVAHPGSRVAKGISNLFAAFTR